MIIKFILINILILLCKTIQVQGNECSCEDLSTATCLDSNKCSLNGSVCGNIICENRSSGQCSPQQTNYKCKWNAFQQICHDYTYQCSEIPYEDCSYNSPKEFNCVSDSNQNCVEFSCGLAIFNCPRNLCSYSLKGQCLNPIQGLNCSTLPSDQCDFYYDGLGHVCNLNTLGKCTSYNLYGLKFRCSEWSDSKIGCGKIKCIYDEDTKQCREFKCTEILDQSDCTKYNYDNEQKIVELCKWYQGQCSSLEISDITNLKEYDCQEKTGMRFCWNQTYGCQPCKQIKIINQSPDFCNNCIQQINTCAKLNNTYPYLTTICFENKIDCSTCPTSSKINSCSDLTNSYSKLIEECYPKNSGNCSNNYCSKSISSCSDLVNNHNEECKKDLVLETNCSQQVTIPKYDNCEELKSNNSDLYPTCCICTNKSQDKTLECPNDIKWIIFMVFFILLFSYSILTTICWIKYYKKTTVKKQDITGIYNGELRR